MYHSDRNEAPLVVFAVSVTEALTTFPRQKEDFGRDA